MHWECIHDVLQQNIIALQLSCTVGTEVVTEAAQKIRDTANIRGLRFAGKERAEPSWLQWQALRPI